MARHRVTYVDRDAPPPAAHRTEVPLGPPAVPPVAPEAPRRPSSGSRRTAVVIVLVAVASLAWVLRPSADPAGEDDARPPAGTVEPDVEDTPLDRRDVLPSPWRGELLREPDARGARLVARIHLLTAARLDGSGRALAVVDATRRAFPGAPRPAGPADRPVRELGVAEGTGLRTWQWDEAGYGISLTAVGLSAAEQQRVAIAIDVPGGRSLVSGRIASWEDDVLGRAGVAPLEVRSGAASLTGGPAIGQPGGASIGGYLTDRPDRAGRSVRLDVTHVPVLTAARVVRALGRPVLGDVRAVPGASMVAVLDHPGEPRGDGVQGWDRVLIDLPGPVTATLSSTSVGADELLELAAAVDLRRLAEEVAPRG